MSNVVKVVVTVTFCVFISPALALEESGIILMGPIFWGDEN